MLRYYPQVARPTRVARRYVTIERTTRCPLFFLSLHRPELALGCATDGALPVGGQFLKGGVGRDATLGVAHGGVVGVGALVALVALALFV